MDAPTRLALPMIAPPLPDVDGLSRNRAGLVVVCSLAHHRQGERAEERDERKVRQVDVMDLLEELLPHSRIRCRQFLPVEGIQGMVAVQGIGCCSRRDLAAPEQERIIRIIEVIVLPLGDVEPARHGSRGR